jgi:sugar phosphate isomerase/epimerase
MTLPRVDRRRVLQGALAGAALTPLASTFAAEEKFVKNGRIKQSIVFWCFNAMGEKWSVEKACEVARRLGVPSIEIIGPEDWPTLKKNGLTCAIAPNGMPGAPFMKGFNNPAYHNEVITVTKKTIDACADFGCPSVIGFTGYRWKNADDPKSGEISRDDGEKNCIKGLKEVAGYAEQKKVTLCIEHLNTRDDSHPMKGHPGYQGDDLDYLAGILRKVGSPRVKLLFDIYHVQIMHGDVIRRIEQTKDVIGHVHTAGNPGRGELDDKQEINYPPIMRKLLEIKYDGYVGQEFIPTRDPFKGLQEAVKWCDV